MAFTFDENGLQIQTLPEVIEELAGEYRTIYGADINLEQSTPDGQRVGIEAKMFQDFQQGLLALWNSFDPDFAQGEQLVKIAKLSGIFPRAAVKSTWDLVVTADRTVTLPYGYQVRDSLDQTWSTTAEQADLTAGTHTVAFTADRWGAVAPAAQDEAVTPVTVIKGVTSVVGAAASLVLGVEEETDAEFRARRQASLQNPSYSTVGALTAKLGQVGGVTQVRVYENDTADDLVLDEGLSTEVTLPPHSIWVVVLGGADEDIAEAIIKQKTMGCLLFGDESVNVEEEVDFPGGGSITITHTARFDRPADHPLSLTVTATDQAGAELSVTAQAILKAAFQAQAFEIGHGVSAGEFYSLGYAALPDQVVLWDLELTDGEGVCTGLCEPGAGRLFSLAAEDITIVNGAV